MPATITNFIIRDLKERLRTDRSLSTDLTLSQLARHYGVSLTPVRLAVNALVDEAVLLKRGNGRLSLNPDRTLPEARSEPPTEPPDWEGRLIEQIVAMSLQGSAQYLREEAMAQRYGVGRTMVRQAFSRLAGKGLIEHVPRCGWRVRTFNEKDMGDYLVVREAMELTALDCARPRFVTADLEKMLRGNTPPWPGGLPLLDNSLHRYWIDRADNAYVRDFFDRHGLYYTALFDFAAPESQRIREMADQHREILVALLADDWTGAKAALAHHIRSQRPVVKRLMERLVEGAAA